MQITIGTSTFIIEPLPARQAIHLMRDVSSILVDTEAVKSLMFKQLFENLFGTGVVIDGVDPVELQKIALFDKVTLISNLIKSAVLGLNEEKLDALIDKCLCNIIHRNGLLQSNALEDLNSNIISDWMTIVELIYQVILINSGGAFDRIKKFLNLLSNSEKIAN
jgi:hypothetical protein